MWNAKAARALSERAHGGGALAARVRAVNELGAGPWSAATEVIGAADALPKTRAGRASTAFAMAGPSP